MNFGFLDRLGFFAKTKLLIFVILFAMITIIVLSQYSIFTFKNDIDTLFQKRTVPVVKLENIKDLYKINVYETVNQYKNGEITLKQAKEVISLARELIEKEWKCYLNKQLPRKGFEALVIQNILELKKRINEQIGNFLNNSEVDFKTLKSNINTINIYLSDIINSNIKKAIEQKNKTDKRFAIVIKASVISIIVVFIFSITLMILIVENFKMIHIDLEEKVKEKTQALEEINKNLEKRIKKAVEENRRKDKIMFQQSKLAAMGEMLQNIAHQWRQPLGSISLILQSIKLKNEMNRLTPEYIDKKTQEALILADSMSKTIDDFKNFFRPDKTRKTLSIKECIYHSRQLVSHLLNKYGIEMEIKIKQDVQILGYKNELSHVCLNILNNAIDSLKNSGVKDKKILIVLRKEKKSIIISMIDNGGGIKEENIEKIFEPYFTTKFKDKGSGIGLYMAKQIIEEHMGGKIRALNIRHKMGTDVMYNCAMFEITLPIKGGDEKL
ncbi:MAG: HAMP domain-containing histidine kinase [Epsilonproteobacteria bacterium]|nr:HAMP domain-containing histidine kinase [Campylobacterota bacterium]